MQSLRLYSKVLSAKSMREVVVEVQARQNLISNAVSRSDSAEFNFVTKVGRSVECDFITDELKTQQDSVDGFCDECLVLDFVHLNHVVLF